MSIMERLRGSTDSTGMQIVLGLIVLAFVGWFALPQGEQVQISVEVNGERVLLQEYGQRYGMEKQLREAGRGPLDEAGELALQNEVKQAIARDLVLSQEAERLGFRVSAEEISRAIKADPRYQDRETNKFDIELYRDAVKASGRTRADLEDDVRKQLMRDKLHAAVTLGVSLDEIAAHAEYDKAFATVDLEVLRIAPDALALAFPSDEATLAAWRADHGDRVQQAYDRDKASRYDIPEQVQLAVIHLQAGDDDREALTARLEDVRAQAQAGADFGDLARKWSEHSAAIEGGDLGMRRVSVLATKVRDAVADLAPGQVSAIVDETDRVSLYKVLARESARTIPFDEVQDDITTRLYRAESAANYVAQVKAGWTDMPPVDLLAQTGIVVQPLPGVMPSQYAGGLGQPPADLVAKAADAEVGTVLDPASTPGAEGDTWFVVRVASRNAADSELYERFRLQKLAEARAQVWDAYAADLQGRADVNMGDRQGTQGNWREWLQGVLPSSS